MLGLDKSIGQMAKEAEKSEPPTYIVKEFIGHRPATKRKGYWELLTRWEGYESSDDTWEPICQKRREVPTLVKEYIAAHPELGTKPAVQQAERLTRNSAATTKNTHPKLKDNRGIDKATNVECTLEVMEKGTDIVGNKMLDDGSEVQVTTQADIESVWPNVTTCDDNEENQPKETTIDDDNEQPEETTIDKGDEQPKKSTMEEGNEPPVITMIATDDVYEPPTTSKMVEDLEATTCKKSVVQSVEGRARECELDHNVQGNFKDETNAGYAKAPYYLSGKICLGCNALITNEIKTNRKEEEGQVFVKPTARYPVWTCRGVPEKTCNQVLCSDCFKSEFLVDNCKRIPSRRA
jgi:hypothetical protein